MNFIFIVVVVLTIFNMQLIGLYVIELINLIIGMLYTGLFYVGARGKEPWTFKHDHIDHNCVQEKEKFAPIEYPKPDGEVTFDLLSSVALTGNYF